jgi:hypothetical protein
VPSVVASPSPRCRGLCSPVNSPTTAELRHERARDQRPHACRADLA